MGDPGHVGAVNAADLFPCVVAWTAGLTGPAGPAVLQVSVLYRRLTLQLMRVMLQLVRQPALPPHRRPNQSSRPACVMKLLHYTISKVRSTIPYCSTDVLYR